MTHLFDYFVILAGMRTGSNFLAASLNQFDNLQCYGELFNPHFIGRLKNNEMFGVDLNQREVAPLKMIANMKASTKGLPGFRLFGDHDPRVLAAALADRHCAKIMLTRNPLDSFISLKIATKTGQWKLSDAKRRRVAKIIFDRAEYEEYLADRHAYVKQINLGLQSTGQTAFHIEYDDIGNRDILNGLAQFLGADGTVKAAAKNIKKQNPTALADKVENYDQMISDLTSAEHLGLSRVLDQEPERGPAVPGFICGADFPLLFIPIPGGPQETVKAWLSRISAGRDLLTGMTQKTLREWLRDHPGQRSFTILRHPLARAHAVFTSHILSNRQNKYEGLRQVLHNRYDVGIPLDGNLAGYSREDHKDAFVHFLKFLKSNLAGQTSVRIDPLWASQSAILQGAASVVMPDLIIREAQAVSDMKHLAHDLKLKAPAYQTAASDTPYALADIYDAQLEKLSRAAYRKDYINFGFSDWTD